MSPFSPVWRAWWSVYVLNLKWMSLFLQSFKVCHWHYGWSSPGTSVALLHRWWLNVSLPQVRAGWGQRQQWHWWRWWLQFNVPSKRWILKRLQCNIIELPRTCSSEWHAGWSSIGLIFWAIISFSLFCGSDDGSGVVMMMVAEWNQRGWIKRRDFK